MPPKLFPLALQSTYLAPITHECSPGLSCVGSCTAHSIRTILSFPTSLWPSSSQAPTLTYFISSAPSPGKDPANWFYLIIDTSVELLPLVWELLDRVKGCVPFCMKCHQLYSCRTYFPCLEKCMFGWNERLPNNDAMYCFIDPLKQPYKRVIRPLWRKP